ncbi:MAG: primosomal protein N' [Bacteroidales bacterium]|nr:primosomal protein N' [Bacteroidales bacterium]MBN2757594.1 primosomal protein N' [Bacteroidales bacterium]
MELFVDLILPVPINQLFTYRVPVEMIDDCEEGKRAVVQFGPKKIYSGIIKKIHNSKPENYKVKSILSILDKNPIINQQQFKLWDWIAEYYMCSVGEVYKAALPAGLRLESNTVIHYNEDFFETFEAGNELKFSKKEEAVLDLLSNNKSLILSDISKSLSSNNVINYIKILQEKGAVKIEESIKSDYKEKTESFVSLSDNLNNEIEINTALDSLKRANKQSELLLHFLEITKYDSEFKLLEISKKELLEKSGLANETLNQLVKKGFLKISKKSISRLINIKPNLIIPPKELNEAQNQAISEIKNQFKEKDTVLLHGVTSSGKTEIYIHLMEEYLKIGKQILYLLPEIALTTQIIERLKIHFGDKIGVYHSRFNNAERVEIWNNISLLDEMDLTRYQIILGVRSSVFLPFSNLGLIIIDEEHENTFKQYNPAPRYHAKDSALVLAKVHNAKTLLGSATPSIETYLNAKTGKFGLVELKSRYKDISMPEIVVSDIKEARRKKQMKSHFSPVLLENIKIALDKKEQVILFQNRRGFSPYIECGECGWIPKCEYCDVSLTYHRNTNQLVCHYCGYAYTNPNSCKACNSTNIKTRGFGTEKVEEELGIFFPNHIIKRMDLDTTVKKNSHAKILSGFEKSEIDILVGTQMVTKGLDFDNVSLVGILDADQMLNFPDFRAYERSYQLMAQVSGRAGRKNKQGKVIIQTLNPKNKIIIDVINNDYNNMFINQLSERKQFSYPPYFRLINITIKHKTIEIVDYVSNFFADELKKIFKTNVLGPEYPIIGRIQNYYLKNILIKIDKKENQNKAKKIIKHIANHIKLIDKFKSVQIVYDVDPQ